MTEFILNEQVVRIASNQGIPLIEIIRQEHSLKGTKLACGEGECGACTVLLGDIVNGNMEYQAVTSCITPLANAQGKHVVTIEGLQCDPPGIVQQAMVENNGTQCGFCTPGFVVSLAGQLLQNAPVTFEGLKSGIDGNICRCTGYKSIERALAQIVRTCQSFPAEASFEDLIIRGVIPEYFMDVFEKLSVLKANTQKVASDEGVIVGGGTDLYVQQPHNMRKANVRRAVQLDTLSGISVSGTKCTIGAAETMSALQNSSVLNRAIPEMHSYLAPIGSTVIRNSATLGGNLMNASPIGDLTILFMGLDADVIIVENSGERKIKLRDLYIGYKKLNIAHNGYLKQIEFELHADQRFNFERVCKRSYLDVASVNSACTFTCDAQQVICNVVLSAGGVAPTPLFLSQTCAFLQGKKAEAAVFLKAAEILQNEISPISDIRGSAEYKRLLLRQQFYLHVTKLSPVSITLHELLRA